MHPKFKPDSIENFKWEEYEDGIHIIDYCGYLFHVCIPETIHGKPVIALSGEYDSVYIPACVKYIRNFVFQNFQYTAHKPDYIIEIDPENPYLRWENGYLYEEHDGECRLAFSYVKGTNFVIDEKVTVLGADAFVSIVNMDFSTLQLPQGLKKIEALRLNGLRKIAPIALPESVEEIVPNENLTFSNLENNPHFLVNGNALLSLDGKKMIAYLGNSTEFIVPETVEEILSYAFFNTNAANLKKLTLSNVKRIHKYAFRHNDINTLRIPAALEYLDDEVLRAISPSSVLVDKKNKYFYTDKIALYRMLEDGKKELLLCFRDKAEDYTVADGTVSILDLAFTNCPALKNLVLPSGLIAFNDDCLNRYSTCTIAFPQGLQKLTVTKKGITKERYSLENNDIYFWEDDVLYEKTDDGLIALRLNQNAETVTLKEGTVTVAKDFANTCSVQTAVCPASLRRIEESAFAQTPLESITLNEDLVFIGHYAFVHTKLKKIHLPATLESFEKFASDTLQTYTVAKESPLYCADKGALYSKDMKKLISVPPSVKGAKFEIPDTVEDIGDAFHNCNKLKEIVLGASIRHLPEQALHYCDKLKMIDCNDALEDVGNLAFPYSSYFTLRMSLHAPFYQQVQTIAKEYPYADFDIKEMSDLTAQYPQFSLLPNPNGISILRYKGDEKNIVFPEKIGEYPVTDIYADVFPTNEYSLESVELPDTITELPPKLFYSCNNLKSVKLPQKITVIPRGCFLYCRHLKELTIPDGVTRIEDAAFFGCEHIEKIVFPASLTEISEHIFSDVDAQGNINYKDLYLSEETIYYVAPGSSAEKFLRAYKPDHYSVKSLSIVYTGDTQNNEDAQRDAELLRYMDHSVLENGTVSLTFEKYGNEIPEKISIPNKLLGMTVTRLSMDIPLTLKELEIPETVTELPNLSSVFRWLNTPSIQKITIHPDNPVFSSDGSAIYTKDRKKLLRFFCAESGEYTIPEGTEIIGENALSYIPTLKKVTLPTSLHTLEASAFRSCAMLDTIEGLGNLPTANIGAFESTPFLQNTPVIIVGKSLVKCNLLDKTSFVVPDGITHIEKGAFLVPEDEANDMLEEIVLPSTLTFIGEAAFRCRKKLNKIILPEGLESIGTNAFFGCVALESLTLPSTLSSLGEDVFPSTFSHWRYAKPFTAKLKEILVADGNESFRSIDGILYSADGTKLICCPIAYPKTEITIPDGVTTIAEKAFYANANIKTVHLPASVTKIENYAFDIAKKLQNINLENVRFLGNSAFESCLELLSVSLQAKEIPQSCFSDCQKLAYVALTDTETIQSNAFNRTPITSITLPETLTVIQENAFYNCQLKRVTIPKSVTEIGSYAFAYCPDITVYDTLDPDLKTKKINSRGVPYTRSNSLGHIGSSNHADLDYEITVRSAQTDEIKYKVWMGISGNTSSYSYLISSCWGEHASFDFKRFDNSFGEIKGLQNKLNIALNRLRYPVDLDESTKKSYMAYIVRMAKDVMKKCIDADDMDTLMLCEPFGIIKKANIDEMLDYAVTKQQAQFSAYFIDYKNKHFQSKKDPFASLQLDLDKPSKDWKTSSAAPNRVTRYQGTDLAVTFPTEVKGKKIFGIASTTTKVPDNYKALVSVVIPEGYTDIGDYAFYACDNLESVTLPSTLQNIGKEAFSHCGKLKEIVIPASVQWMGDGVFYDCVNLSKVIIEQGALRTLPAYAFSECDKLTEIELPQNIDTLNTLCLNCDRLRKLTLHTRKLTTNGYIFGNTIPEIHAYKGAIKRIQGVTRNNIFLMEDTKDEAHDVVQTELVADGIFRFTPVDSITFADKIFVLTGFGAEDEDRITDIIVKNGGIIKSSVVLKTNYLIVNSEYDHETAKYLKALELLEQGKNIAIISEQQFKTFS